MMNTMDIAVQMCRESIIRERAAIKCPNCGESYYQYYGSTSTNLDYIPVYKDGILLNKDPNKTTKHYQCLNCGEEFSRTTQY